MLLVVLHLKDVGQLFNERNSLVDVRSIRKLIMKPLTKASDIFKSFAIGSLTRDIDLLENLLHKDGEFETENENDPSYQPQVGKQAYLSWYERKLETTEITSIQYDQCLFCAIGNPVPIFNNGEFPRLEK